MPKLIYLLANHSYLYPMKTLVLRLSIILFCIQSFAQVQFKEGHYITTKGDTIKGLIKDYDWNDNPEKVTFKNKTSNSKNNFRPEDIAGFEIYNKVKYTSSFIDTDISRDDVSRLDNSRLPIFDKKHLFLKVIVEGKASLYKHSSTYNTRYYYEINGSSLKMLIYKKYMNSDNKIDKNNNFRQQLLNNLKCDELSKSQFASLNYTEKDLRKIISKYNACFDDETYSFQEQKRKQSFFISIRPGIQMASIKIDNTVTNEKIDFDDEVSYRIGLEFEYILSFNNNKWSVIVEPTYQNYSTTKVDLIQRFLERTREVNYSSIEFPIGVRYYTFLSENHQLFGNGGIVLDYVIGDEHVVDERSQTINFDKSFNPYIGIGYRFKENFSLEIRYQTFRGLFSGRNSNLKANYSSIGVIAGYRFF